MPRIPAELAGLPDQLRFRSRSSPEQKPFIALVDRILAAKQRDLEADTSALEGEVDELVYALYGLTPEEMKIIEAAGTRQK